MCEVSDKLKLCSCFKVAFGKARHYWILHRFIKDKFEIVIGLPMLPHFLSVDVDTKNKKLLLSLLNQPDTFDSDITPREGDLLELSFLCGEKEQRITYGFKYKRGKWHEEQFDPLHWMWHHEQELYGK